MCTTRCTCSMLMAHGRCARGAEAPAQEYAGTQPNDCCGVVWCGVALCGVVWCGVVWGGVVRMEEGHSSDSGYEMHLHVNHPGIGHKVP